MTNILIAILLLYNMWLVFCLLNERRQEKRTGRHGPPPEPEKPGSGTDIMGKSLFRMPEGRTAGDTAVPQAATSAEGEALAVDEVTFAPGNIRRTSVQIPDDRLDEAFSNTRLSDVPVEYAAAANDPPGEHASGATIEEMNEAIRTADNPEATDADKRKAGEVFHEMEGNGLYEILMTGKPGIRNRILGLIDHYKSQTAVPTEGDREAVQDSPRNIPAVEGLDDFDIRDFV